MNPLAIIALIAVGLFIASKGQAAASLSSVIFQFKKIQATCEGFLCSTPVIQITVTAVNPTDRSVQIRSFAGQVALNSQLIGDVYALNIPPLAANGTTDITMSVRGSTLDLLNQAVKLIRGEIQTNVVLTFTGNANAEGVLIPLRFDVKVL